MTYINGNSSAELLAIIYVIFEIVKFLVNKLMPKSSSLTEDERYQLKELHSMHDVKDDQGRPIWYMPNQVGQQQEKIIELLNEMSKTQNDTTHVLERILDRLDRT